MSFLSVKFTFVDSSFSVSGSTASRESGGDILNACFVFMLFSNSKSLFLFQFFLYKLDTNMQFYTVSFRLYFKLPHTSFFFFSI